jgi:hypothetical protein
VHANPDVVLEGGTDAAGQERGIRFELERGFGPAQGQRVPVQEHQRFPLEEHRRFAFEEHRALIVQLTGQEQAPLRHEPGLERALHRLTLVQLALNRQPLEWLGQSECQRPQADLRRRRFSRGQG